MTPRRVLAALVAVGISLAIYDAWPREALTPEGEVRAAIAAAVHSAEQRDPAGVVALLGPTFRGPQGITRDEVKQLLVGQFFRAQQIGVMNPSLEVRMGTPPTTAQFKGLFVFARDGAAVEASSYVIEGDVEKTPDGWRVSSASWHR